MIESASTLCKMSGPEYGFAAICKNSLSLESAAVAAMAICVAGVVTLVFQVRVAPLMTSVLPSTGTPETSICKTLRVAASPMMTDKAKNNMQKICLIKKSRCHS